MEEKTKVNLIIVVCIIAIVIFGFGKYFAITGEKDLPIILTPSSGATNGEYKEATYYENFFGQKSITLNYSLSCSKQCNSGFTSVGYASVLLGDKGIAGVSCGLSCHCCYMYRTSYEKGSVTVVFDKVNRKAKIYKTGRFVRVDTINGVHCDGWTTGSCSASFERDEDVTWNNDYIGEIDLSGMTEWKLKMMIQTWGSSKSGSTQPLGSSYLELSNLIVETVEKKEFDGYMYYDDFNNNYLDPNLWNVEKSGDVDILVDSGRTLIYTGVDGKVTLSPKKTFETEDVKLYFIPQNSEVYFAGQRLFTPIESAETVIEVRHRFKNDREVSIIVNGIQEQVFDTTGKVSNLKIVIPANQLIKIYYLKNKVIESCQLTGGNYMLGIESFIGPQDITLYSTRYPVRKFCPTMHPFTATRVDTENEVYYDLASGEKWSVKSGEVLTLFYIFENDGNIPLTCGENAYDVKNNKCVNASGVVFFCTEGVYNSDVGACVLIAPIITRECASVSDCPEPYCAGVYYICDNNLCIRHGSCIQPPIPGTTNIWNLISQVWINFWNWVKGLFS